MAIRLNSALVSAGGVCVCGSALDDSVSPSVVMSPPVHLPVFALERKFRAITAGMSTRYQVTSLLIVTASFLEKRFSMAAKTAQRLETASVGSMFSRRRTSWPV